jgi:hypothetical protein
MSFSENILPRTACLKNPARRLLIAAWDDARRAENYRFRAVKKANNQEIANQIAQDSETTLVFTNAPPGIEVDITVTTRNAMSESIPTEPVIAHERIDT